MSSSFRTDDHPGRPRILFVGLGESSHTHGWIDLLRGARLNVRLFAGPTGIPPREWPVRTYVTAYTTQSLDPATRARFYSRLGALRIGARVAWGALGRDTTARHERWLARIVSDWQPHVVHTFGLDAARFYFSARETLGASGPRWVLQTHGGSDLALGPLNPELRNEIGTVLRACDQLLDCSEPHLDVAREMGVRESQISMGAIPGAGGVDIDDLRGRWHGPPSTRDLVLVPKAYDCAWSQVLPVLEALKITWERLGSNRFRVCLLAATPETRMWCWSLPDRLRDACSVEDRLPHAGALDLMTRARVMVAPSMVDGVPNSLYEAMAAGAFPIVSPIETILSVVTPGRDVLAARNLYPDEIADALTRALTDDAFVDGAAETNVALVRRLADRKVIRSRVVAFYESLAR